MEGYPVASRFDEDFMDSDCPVCRNGRQNFMDLGFGLLGCFQCGNVFVSKKVREKERVLQKIKLEMQAVAKPAKEPAKPTIQELRRQAKERGIKIARTDKAIDIASKLAG